MGACATKPKVLGDNLTRRRSRKRRPSSRSYITNESPSSLKDEKGSISFSHYKDQDIVASLEDEVEDVDSETEAPDHYVHQDTLPSYDDDGDLDIHDPSIKDEAEQIRSAITKAIEQSKNDVAEEAESSGPIPTNEIHLDDEEATLIPAGVQDQNDDVEKETSAGQYDVVAEETPAGVEEAESSHWAPATENDAVVVEEAVNPPSSSYTSKEIESALMTDGVLASSLPHHASRDVEMCGPTQSDYDAHDHDHDHVIKGEDDAISANNMPSTFAF